MCQGVFASGNQSMTMKAKNRESSGEAPSTSSRRNDNRHMAISFRRLLRAALTVVIIGMVVWTLLVFIQIARYDDQRQDASGTVGPGEIDMGVRAPCVSPGCSAGRAATEATRRAATATPPAP